MSTTSDSIIDQGSNNPPVQPPRHRGALLADSFEGRARWAAPWLGMLVVAIVLSAFRDRWFVQVALLAWLLLAPGRLLLTALRLRTIQVRRFPVYPVAMSLLIIMATGLVVDGIGTAVGDPRPLRTGPLLVGTAAGYLLLVAAAATAPARCRPSLSRVPSLRPFGVLVLPLLAVFGAERLNSGHGSTAALVAMIALVAVWLARPFLPSFTWRSASITVYAVSLAGMWSFSLRGDSVYGYDIITEYFIARTTDANGVWHLNHLNDAYGALLSVTILPISLHSVAGVTLMSVFKVVFPAIFAFVPVGVLRIAQRLVSVRWAYVAVGLVIGQSFFFDSMPAVARQEIAFVLFVALVGALLEPADRLIGVLVALCAVGMVFAHYSSTYMAAALTGAAVLFAAIGWALRRRPPIVRPLVAFVVLLGGALLWYRGLTDSASNVSSVTSSLTRSGFNLLPNRRSNIISTLVEGNVSPSITYSQYAAEIARYYAEHLPYVHTYTDASKFPLQAAPATTSGSGTVGVVGGPTVTVINQLVNLLAVVGTFVLTFGRGRGAVARLLGLLSLGVLGFLAAVRVSGTLALAYNQERAQIQAFIVLAPVATWAVRWLGTVMAGRARVTKGRSTSFAAVTCGVLASSVLVANASGLITSSPTVDGTANVSASGEDVARFVLLSDDLEAALWLSRANQGRSLEYGDAYGSLRLLAAQGSLDNIAPDITPRTLGRGTWVYADSQNILRRTARASYQGHAVKYEFPLRYLGQTFDTVFTNGAAKIFRGQ